MVAATPTPVPTGTPSITPTPTSTPLPELGNADVDALMATPTAFLSYPVRLGVVAGAGPFLSQCFKCPPAQQRGVFSFRITRPLLTPLFEAFLFSDRRLGVADSRLLIQVTGTVGC